MEKIIHFVVTDSYSRDVKNNIETAKSLNPGWEIKVWSTPPNDNDYGLSDYYKFASSPAVMRNMMALDVIFLHGGIFLDSSICLIKSLDCLSSLDHFFIGEEGEMVSTAFFGAERSHPIIQFLSEEVIKKTAMSGLLNEKETGSDLFRICLRWYPDIFMLPASMLVSVFNKSGKHSLSHLILGVINQKRIVRNRKDVSQILNLLNGGMKSVFFLPGRFLKRLVTKLFNYMFLVGGKTTRVHYPFGTDIITRMNNGINISLPGKDLSIVPHVVLGGNYWEGELRFVENILSEGDFFIDVGCNVGIYTLVAAKCNAAFWK